MHAAKKPLKSKRGNAEIKLPISVIKNDSTKNVDYKDIQ
jgi:hypothetical protein